MLYSVVAFVVFPPLLDFPLIVSHILKFRSNIVLFIANAHLSFLTFALALYILIKWVNML